MAAFTVALAATTASAHDSYRYDRGDQIDACESVGCTRQHGTSSDLPERDMRCIQRRSMSVDAAAAPASASASA